MSTARTRLRVVGHVILEGRPDCWEEMVVLDPDEDRPVGIYVVLIVVAAVIIALLVLEKHHVA